MPLSWTSEEHNATAEQLGLINNFGDQENYNNYTRPIHCGSSYTVYGGARWTALVGLRMISPSAPAAPYAHRMVHRIVYRKCRSAPVLGAACAPIPPYEQSG